MRTVVCVRVIGVNENEVGSSVDEKWEVEWMCGCKQETQKTLEATELINRKMKSD